MKKINYETYKKIKENEKKENDLKILNELINKNEIIYYINNKSNDNKNKKKLLNEIKQIKEKINYIEIDLYKLKDYEMNILIYKKGYKKLLNIFLKIENEKLLKENKKLILNKYENDIILTIYENII